MYQVQSPGEFPVGKTYQGYQMVAAIVASNQGKVNGYPVYCVAGVDSERNCAVTWMANYQQSDKGSGDWYVTFYWGHYFHGRYREMEAIERAMVDLVKRVGITSDTLLYHVAEL